MSTVKSLPPRSAVAVADQWDLSSLFKSDAEWEKAFGEWEARFDGFARFKGKLGESAELLLEMLEYDAHVDRLGDRLGCYAGLKTTEDQGNSEYQRMRGRFAASATKLAEVTSFVRPELMAVPVERMNQLLASEKL